MIRIKLVSELLSENNYHSLGEEVLYRLLVTGEQIETSFFMGPTYYTFETHGRGQINYRLRGPGASHVKLITVVQMILVLKIGRWNVMGLYLMVAPKFLQDSMMKRGDEYVAAGM